MFEEEFASTSLAQFIIETLSKEKFAENGRVKCLIQKADIPRSIQWMTKVSRNEWKMAEISVVFYPASSFAELFRNNTEMEIDQVLLEILGEIPNPDYEKFYISLLKEKPSKTGTNEDKSFEAEFQRMIVGKAHDLSVDSLVLHKTNFSLDPLDQSKAYSRVCKTTKSVLESIKPPEDFGSWYPKEVKQSVSVGKKKVGLNKLWQRCLMQISQNVNVEQAKVISNEPEFSSLNNAIKTYENCLHDEKQAVELLSNKALRPNGATKDSLTLGNKRPSVGVETSRKIFKTLTTLDPELEI